MAGRVVLVTGAAGPGLGSACARMFAAAVALVVVTDVSARRVGQMSEEVQASGAAGVLAVRLDVTDNESVKACVARVINEWGRVDVLVNNAALTGKGTAGGHRNRSLEPGPRCVMTQLNHQQNSR